MTDQDMEIWKAGYDLHEKYGEGPKTDADWKRLTDDCKDLFNRFGGSSFAFAMALFLLDFYDARRDYRQDMDAWDQIKMSGCE